MVLFMLKDTNRNNILAAPAHDVKGLALRSKAAVLNSLTLLLNEELMQHHCDTCLCTKCLQHKKNPTFLI